MEAKAKAGLTKRKGRVGIKLSFAQVGTQKLYSQILVNHKAGVPTGISEQTVAS